MWATCVFLKLLTKVNNRQIGRKFPHSGHPDREERLFYQIILTETFSRKFRFFAKDKLRKLFSAISTGWLLQPYSSQTLLH
jgi:hypothetical protein